MQAKYVYMQKDISIYSCTLAIKKNYSPQGIGLYDWISLHICFLFYYID